jgi:hypothetical protein
MLPSDPNPCLARRLGDGFELRRAEGRKESVRHANYLRRRLFQPPCMQPPTISFTTITPACDSYKHRIRFLLLPDSSGDLVLSRNGSVELSMEEATLLTLVVTHDWECIWLP